MLFPTHILIGLFSFFLFEPFLNGGNEILLLIFVLLGSLLPDIDEKHSKATQWTGLIGQITSFFSKHRGFFHSLFFLILTTLTTKYVFNEYYAWGIFIGITSHLLADSLTKQGLPIMYPFSFKIKGFFKTNGWGEKLIQTLIFTFLIIKTITII